MGVGHSGYIVYTPPISVWGWDIVVTSCTRPLCMGVGHVVMSCITCTCMGSVLESNGANRGSPIALMWEEGCPSRQ